MFCFNSTCEQGPKTGLSGFQVGVETVISSLLLPQIDKYALLCAMKLNSEILRKTNHINDDIRKSCTLSQFFSKRFGISMMILNLKVLSIHDDI